MNPQTEVYSPDFLPRERAVWARHIRAVATAAAVDARYLNGRDYFDVVDIFGCPAVQSPYASHGAGHDPRVPR